MIFAARSPSSQLIRRLWLLSDALGLLALVDPALYIGPR
jgi:hypothetical protein